MFPPSSYSIGSSAVTILRSPLSFSRSADANVVDFPEPVGPETMIIPLASLRIERKFCLIFTLLMSLSRLNISWSLLRNRITIFSPCLPGAVAQRNSIVCPSKRRRILPSWDARRSAISILAMFL